MSRDKKWGVTPSAPRLILLTALLFAALAPPAEAQYMYIDANGDGAWSSADQLNPDTTTLDVWLNTNTNRDGSVSTCNDRTGLPVGSVSLLSNTTLGSAEVTSDDPSRFAVVVVGMTVSGAAIPGGATVVAKESNSRMTLSAAALTSGSGPTPC